MNEHQPLPDAAALTAWDKAHVWHPFTPMRQYAAGDPLIIQRGRGVKVQDLHGRWYYDGTSSLWLNVHGHGVPEIDAAIRRQLDDLAHSTLLGQSNVPAVRLARRLVGIAPPGLSRVFFSDCGAAAVEAALKIAVQYWANLGRRGRTGVLGFTTNYHGDTLGAMAVAPDELFHGPFLSLLPPNPRAPYPFTCRYDYSPDDPPGDCAAASLQAVRRIMERQAQQLAAVIVEPVQGAGGIIPAPRGFLAGLRQLCDEFDLLMIVDEVATGFGRTGRMFACEHDGVAPDLLCLGKGLTGGYLPVSATLATERIFDAFCGEIGERRTFFHGHSYAGNPLGCAAALANLDLLEELLPALPDKIGLLQRRLAPLRELAFVGDLRQAGMMVGVELVAERESKRPFAYDRRAGFVVTDAARELGLIVRPIGNVVIFMPPLASTAEELNEMCGILNTAFERAMPALARFA